MNLAATEKLKTQVTQAEEESVPRYGRRGPGLSGMTAFASFRSDCVSCAGTLSQLIRPDFVNNLSRMAPYFGKPHGTLQSTA